MLPNGGYIESMIAGGIAFLLSIFVFRLFRRKWLGCIVQFIAFIILFLVMSTIVWLYMNLFVSSANKEDSMVGVRAIEEDRNCRIVNEWWMKADDTYYYECDKGIVDDPETVVPCDIELWGDRGTYTRLDSLNAIKVNINPDLVIYFDLDSQRVTPIYNKDTIEVISTDWNRIKEYFKQQ